MRLNARALVIPGRFLCVELARKHRKPCLHLCAADKATVSSLRSPFKRQRDNVEIETQVFIILDALHACLLFTARFARRARKRVSRSTLSIRRILLFQMFSDCSAWQNNFS